MFPLSHSRLKKILFLLKAKNPPGNGRVFCLSNLLDNRDLNAPMLASKSSLNFLFNASWACPEVLYFKLIGS